MIRAVLDANVCASALIQSKGPSGRILRHLFEKRAFQLVTSQAFLDELERCLFYPRVRKRIPITDEALRQWLAAIGMIAEVVTDPPELSVVVDDPDDNAVLAAALEGRADYIVTGDRALLDLGEYEGIRNVTPVQFARTLGV